MTRKTLLVVGITVIAIALGVWAYVLIFAPSAGEGIFARFGAGDDASYVPPPAEEFVDGSEEYFDGEITTSRLHQLTTGPVAGAVFANGGILYVEQGTGHIQFLDFASSTETIVSGTTIPGAYDAQFSDDGETVAITTAQNGVAKTVVATVPTINGTGALEGVALPLGASEVDLTTKAGTAYYILRTSSGARGFAYSISKKTSTEVFNIPVRDVHVLWGDPLYVYTTPSVSVEGYVYKVVGNELRYVTEGGAGLMAYRYKDTAVTTQLYPISGKLEWVSRSGYILLEKVVIPEKCVTWSEGMFCAVPQTIDAGFPDSWYKGTISYSDSLWEMSVANDTAYVMSDFFTESGRQIDVLKIGIDSLGTRLWFINKNDNTLWEYQLD